MWRLYGLHKISANRFEKSAGICINDRSLEIIMAVTIQLFGQLKQIAGSSELTTEAMDTDGLLKEMAARFPILENLKYLIAIDRTIVQTNTGIKAGQELALLPPYSGG
jgi:molybdopterin synthase sulfur carrier subunit